MKKTATTTTATMAARLLVTALFFFFFFAAALPFAVAAKPYSSPPVCDSQGPRKDCGEFVSVLVPLTLCFSASNFSFRWLDTIAAARASGSVHRFVNDFPLSRSLFRSFVLHSIFRDATQIPCALDRTGQGD